MTMFTQKLISPEGETITFSVGTHDEKIMEIAGIDLETAYDEGWLRTDYLGQDRYSGHLYIVGTREGIEHLKYEAVRGRAKSTRVTVEIHPEHSVIETRVGELLSMDVAPMYPDSEVREEMRERLLRGYRRPVHVSGHRRRA